MLIRKSVHLLRIFLFTTLFLSGIAHAQKPENTNLKHQSNSIFIKARQKYNEGDSKRAEKLLNQLISKDPSFAQAYILLGNINIDNYDTLTAIRHFEKALQYDSTQFPGLYVYLSRIYFERLEFLSAKNTLKRFFNQSFPDTVLNKNASILFESCVLSEYYREKPVIFEPQNLGKSINTEGNEYINAISSDGQLLIFTRKSSASNATEDFYISQYVNGQWQTAELFVNSINSEGNEGSLSLSPDGQILFFAGCNRKDGFGSCDIYYSLRKGIEWENPINGGPIINSVFWDSQPCLAADGRTLYFVSTRPGGFGKSDIWKTYYDKEKGWLTPVNAGSQINTAEDEFSPFFHPDGQTLFFASKGHPTIGGFDIYRTLIQNDGSFSKPDNIGYPINTGKDEIGMIVGISGEDAYFSTDNLKGEGGQDIYSFILYESIRPGKVAFMKGKTFDIKTSKPISAHFEIIDIQNNKTIIESESDELNGEFLICIPVEGQYVLNASAEGYLFFSEHFSLKESGYSNETSIRNVPMQPIDVGESVILRNIFFDTDQWELNPKSMVELEILFQFINNSPSISVEISGHTDNTGNENHNQLLSEKRAEAVYNYLTNKGVNKNRLTFKGYGSSNPVSSNDSPQGRSENRRTEFKITGK